MVASVGDWAGVCGNPEVECVVGWWCVGVEGLCRVGSLAWLWPEEPRAGLTSGTIWARVGYSVLLRPNEPHKLMPKQMPPSETMVEKTIIPDECPVSNQ